MKLISWISVLAICLFHAFDTRADELLLGDDSVKNYLLVGQTYSGCGNAAGLGTDMTIEFKRNGVCYCTSDWYRAYAEPVKVKGTYKIDDTIDGTTVSVSCNNFTFEFTKKDENLYFDRSTTGEGSVNNNFMSLVRVSR